MLLTKKSRDKAERKVQEYLGRGLPSFAAYEAERAGLRQTAAECYEMVAKEYRARGPEWRIASEIAEDKARRLRRRPILFFPLVRRVS